MCWWKFDLCTINTWRRHVMMEIPSCVDGISQKLHRSLGFIASLLTALNSCMYWWKFQGPTPFHFSLNPLKTQKLDLKLPLAESGRVTPLSKHVGNMHSQSESPNYGLSRKHCFQYNFSKELYEHTTAFFWQPRHSTWQILPFVTLLLLVALEQYRSCLCDIGLLPYVVLFGNRPNRCNEQFLRIWKQHY